jgi:hypothetical protein
MKMSTLEAINKLVLDSTYILCQRYTGSSLLATVDTSEGIYKHTLI